MDIKRQHLAVQQSAGVLDYSSRGKVRVQGPDHVSFLHSMISHDVEKLQENQGRYATFLTHNGKLISDFFFYKFRQHVLVDLNPGRAPGLVESLNRFVIMDDVELVDESPLWDHVSVQGPMAAAILEDLFSAPLPRERYEVREVPSERALLINRAELAESGYEVLLPRGAGEACISGILRKFESQGVLEVEEEAHNILRLELGIPWFGVDMDENNYPMEAGLEESISLTKGCFVGQEVVAKATHIGGVRRRLGKLLVSPGSEIPEKGAGVLKDEKKVGSVTSAVESIRLQRPIALAYLIQSRVSTGDPVSVVVNGKAVPASVVDSF